jgi:hypothetical protein
MRYPGQDGVEVEVGTGTGGIIREEKRGRRGMERETRDWWWMGRVTTS